MVKLQLKKVKDNQIQLLRAELEQTKNPVVIAYLVKSINQLLSVAHVEKPLIYHVNHTLFESISGFKKILRIGDRGVSVITYLISCGDSFASDLAKQLDIPRTEVYHIMTHLIEIDIAGCVDLVQKKRSYYLVDKEYPFSQFPDNLDAEILKMRKFKVELENKIE